MLSLAITLIVTISLTSLYRLVSYSQKPVSFDEDIYICAKQVSQYVLGSYTKEIGESYIYKGKDEQDITLQLHDNRLVKTPGFEILLTDVDDVFFDVNDQLVYMKITRNEKVYTFLINYLLEKADENNEVDFE